MVSPMKFVVEGLTMTVPEPTVALGRTRLRTMWEGRIPNTNGTLNPEAQRGHVSVHRRTDNPKQINRGRHAQPMIWH